MLGIRDRNDPNYQKFLRDMADEDKRLAQQAIANQNNFIQAYKDLPRITTLKLSMEDIGKFSELVDKFNHEIEKFINAILESISDIEQSFKDDNDLFLFGAEIVPYNACCYFIKNKVVSISEKQGLENIFFQSSQYLKKFLDVLFVYLKNITPLRVKQFGEIQEKTTLTCFTVFNFMYNQIINRTYETVKMDNMEYALADLLKNKSSLLGVNVRDPPSLIFSKPDQDLLEGFDKHAKELNERVINSVESAGTQAPENQDFNYFDDSGDEEETSSEEEEEEQQDEEEEQQDEEEEQQDEEEQREQQEQQGRRGQQKPRGLHGLTRYNTIVKGYKDMIDNAKTPEAKDEIIKEYLNFLEGQERLRKIQIGMLERQSGNGKLKITKTYIKHTRKPYVNHNELDDREYLMN